MGNHELDELKRISETLGQNKDIIQATGGNTSLKQGELIWVKASGKALVNANKEEIFLPINLKESKSRVEELTEGPINFKATNNSELRPSIETALHILMPQKYVIHTHPIDVIASSVRVNSNQLLKEKLNGLDIAIIEYMKPGLPLAREVSKTLKNKQVSIIILKNHGLVIGVDSSDEAMELHRKISMRLAMKERQTVPPNTSVLKEAVEQLNREKVIARLPISEKIHSIGNDYLSKRIALNGSLFPDHVVFCGKKPTVIEIGNLKNIGTPNIKSPPYLLVEGYGVILLNRCTKEAEEMLEAEAKVLLRLEEIEGLNFLTDEQCDELINWDAEIYRKQLASKADRGEQK